MKRKIIMTLSALLVLAVGAQAQTVFQFTDSSQATDKTWTISDLNNANPTVTGAKGSATGSLTGAGRFDAAESFTIKATAYSGWNTIAASNALAADASSPGAFTNYLYSLNPEYVRGTTSALGVDSTRTAGTDVQYNRIGNQASATEVLAFEVDLSNLTSTNQISLSQVHFNVLTADDRIDMIIFDVSEGTVTTQSWDSVFDYGSDTLPLDATLSDGDLIIWGAGISSGAAKGYRVQTLTLDADAPDKGVTPPAGFGGLASNKLVQVDWLDQTTPSFDYYNLYRGLVSSNYVLLAGGLTNSVYTDLDVTNGVTYYYVATSVNLSSLETEYCPEISVTPHIFVPTSLAASSTEGQVDVTWDPSSDRLFSTFNIYRRVDPSTNFTLLASDLTTTNYTDTAVTNKMLYFYKVSVVDFTAEESELSGEVTGEPTTDLVIVNSVNNEQSDIRCAAIDPDGTYAMYGTGTTLGQFGIGAYTFDQLSRPVHHFPLSVQDLANVGKTTNDIDSVTLRIHVDDSNSLRPKIDTKYEYLDPLTNVVDDVTNIVYQTTNIVSITTNGPGSAVLLYASASQDASVSVANSEFSNTTYQFVTEVTGLTSETPLDTWVEIDVTDVVLNDLINDNQTNGTAGCAFRYQVLDDHLMDTNDNYKVNCNDNYDAETWLSPQLRIKWKIGTPYDSWAAEFGVPADNTDSDLDGFNNLYEYGMDGNPTNPATTGALPKFVPSGAGFLFIHPVRSDDGSLIYTVKTTTNLVSGAWTATGYTTGGTGVINGTLNELTNIVTAVEDEKFIRVDVTQ